LIGQLPIPASYGQILFLTANTAAIERHLYFIFDSRLSRPVAVIQTKMFFATLALPFLSPVACFALLNYVFVPTV
jgi:hypothetical protein